MKKLLILAAALALTPVSFAANPAAAAQTMKGEILDMACYMGHGAKGPKHAGCAKGCVAAGAPMGLLSESGTVYLLVENHADKKAKKAYNAAKDLAGSKASVTGSVVTRGGIQAIVVNSVSKA